MDWFGRSLLATLCIAPVFLSINFFGRNYQMKPEVITIWYFLGAFFGCVAFSMLTGAINVANLAPNRSALMVLAVGFLLGGAANIFLFQAISSAPNPGLPVAFVNASSLIVYAASIGLALVLPKYFAKVSLDSYHLLGVALTIVGLAIISIRR